MLWASFYWFKNGLSYTIDVSEILQLIEIKRILGALFLALYLRYWLFVISYSNNK